MYIEKRKHHSLLCKKIQGKKFCISFQWKVSQDHITQLSQKELIRQMNQDNYSQFGSLLFDDSYLQEITRDNILMHNTMHANIPSGKKQCITEKFQNFYKEFIFQSNQTEWSRIPREEVEKILSKKKSIYSNYNEIIEVKNSYESWEYLLNDFSFTLNHIKRLYHILTKNLLQENGSPYPKGFKKVVNVIGNNPTSAPEQVTNDLQQLIQWYQSNKNILFPVQLAFEFHLRYEQIHPFLNGNWRTGRLIMNKILINNSFSPMLIYAENREKYFNAITSAYQTQRRKKYYSFMTQQYIKTLRKYYLGE